MFAALAQRMIDVPFDLELIIADVEELNEMVLAQKIDVSKISCHLLTYIYQDYCFLPVGAALGRGCGPLLVTRPEFGLDDLFQMRVAMPGKYTTAYALFRQFAPNMNQKQVIFTRFDHIMPMIQNGEADFGIIIHEGRFVYQRFGLKCVCDLGEWWEQKTAFPIPLGGIVAQRRLGVKNISLFTDALKRSILFAYANRRQVMPFVQKYACHLEQEVIQRHIKLYVNDFSLDLGSEGKMAIERLINHSSEEWICVREEYK